MTGWVTGSDQSHAEDQQDKTGKTDDKVIGDPCPEHPHLGHAFGLFQFFFIGLNKKPDRDDGNEAPMVFTLIFSTRQRIACPNSCTAMVMINASQTARVEGT